MNGEFWLEDKLVKEGIPFDRWSEGHYDIVPEMRYFRPAEDGKAAIDLTFEHGAGIPFTKLKKLIADDSIDLKAYIDKQLHEDGYYIDIPDIESYK